jgi:hypothetical protein
MSNEQPPAQPPQPPLYPIPEGFRTSCMLRTPVWLIGIGTDMVRRYFSTSDRIALEKSQFLYDRDPSKSQIFIDIQENFNTEVAGKRPAIICSLGPQQFDEKVINANMLSQGPQGDFQYASINQTSLIYSCFGHSVIEALSLASELKYFFITYRPILCNEYGIERLALRQINPAVKFKEYRDYYTSQINVELQCSETWEVTQEALRVKQIGFALTIKESP